jgi:chromosome segregation ATPase
MANDDTDSRKEINGLLEELSSTRERAERAEQRNKFLQRKIDVLAEEGLRLHEDIMKLKKLYDEQIESLKAELAASEEVCEKFHRGLM